MNAEPRADAPAVGVATSHEASIGTDAGSVVSGRELAEPGSLRPRWNEIEGAFVDEPLAAVQQADALVSELISEITRAFAEELAGLESQWQRGSDVSTEKLRTTLQQYRSFFNRLLK